MLGAIENTMSPAMSPDGKTVYMYADQSATDAYDVALKAFDAASGAEKWSFDVNAALAQLNENGGVRLCARPQELRRSEKVVYVRNQAGWHKALALCFRY